MRRHDRSKLNASAFVRQPRLNLHAQRRSPGPLHDDRALVLEKSGLPARVRFDEKTSADDAYV
jgi:hypothetical protein